MSFATKGFEKTSLAGVVKKVTGVSVQRCYQCGKCSAGCPAASEMDDAPSVVLHLLQTDTEAADTRVLRSYSIWLCVTCNTCVARCPMEVDLPKVMDALRSESVKRRMVHPKAKDIVAFHKSFINSIRHFGRMWEIGVFGEYKLRTRHFWQDLVLAPSMIRKGKLPLLPEFHKKLVNRIFARIRGVREEAR
jgi:heterodisulfide reductase subunit C